MFEWFAGLAAGLSRRANPGMVVCVALICVTALAWAPLDHVTTDDIGETTARVDTLAETVLLIVAILAVALTLSYLISRTRSPDQDNTKDE